MSDSVQSLLEEQIPELEDLERKGVFTKAEIKQLVRRRAGYERALRRRAPVKADFLRYIKHEMQCEALRRHRKRKSGFNRRGSNLAGGPSEHSIVRRIHFIYERALRKFKGDLSLWHGYLDFCKSLGSRKMLSRALAKALALHPTEPALWSYAASWEMESQGNARAARSLMQDGLRYNPRSFHLWLDYFQMELAYAEKLASRRSVLGLSDRTENEDFDRVLAGEAALIVFRKASEAVPLNPSQRFSFARAASERSSRFSEIVREILDSIRSDFRGDSQAVEMIANSWLDDILSPSSHVESSRMVKACEEFESALHQDGANSQLWHKYASFLDRYCGRMVDAGNLSPAVDSAKRCTSVCARAQDCGALLPGTAQCWVRCLERRGAVQDAISVTSHAVELWPKDVEVLGLQLKVVASRSEAERAHNMVLTALANAERVNTELWLTGIEVFIAQRLDIRELVPLVSAQLARGEEAIEKPACALLDSLGIQHGMNDLRDALEQWRKQPFVPLELLRRGIEIERAANNLDRAAKLIEFALARYGERDLGLWIELLDAERGRGRDVAHALWRAGKSIRDKGDKERLTQAARVYQV